VIPIEASFSFRSEYRKAAVSSEETAIRAFVILNADPMFYWAL